MSDEQLKPRRQLNVADFFKLPVGESAKPKTRRFRFSLRTLLLTVSVYTVLLALAVPLWRSGYLGDLFTVFCAALFIIGACVGGWLVFILWRDQD
jgi:hypothetical protein